MKMIIVMFLLLVTSVAHAGLLKTLAMNSGMPTTQTKSSYLLDVRGYDVRVYEWVPKDNPNVRCVFVAGNENSSGVACYKVETK